ncbi:MAG: flagellar assembly protein FliW [Brevinema sp.]
MSNNMIKTRDFGDIEVSQCTSVTFKKPLFGFEYLTEFYLIPLQEPEQFTILQSKEDINVSFTMTQPSLFLSDYVLDINDDDASVLEFENHEDLYDFAIVTISENIEDITMNILGPVIINKKNGFAIQTISNCSYYTTTCRLFPKKVSVV